MTLSENELDILIIGGGPAGLAAAIYAIRARRKCLIIDKVFPGGQLMYTAFIENYPGFPKGSSGMELAAAMTEQVQRLGVKTLMEEAEAIQRAPNGFLVKTPEKDFQTRSVIIATGASWKRLDVPGEKELSGKGISYCATCDAPLFRDKEVVLVGGGDTALCEALYLTRFVKRLHLIHRRDALRAEKILQERAFANDKISFVWNSVVTKITGTKSVESVEILNKITNETQILPTEGVFIFVGNIPNTGFVPDFVAKNEQGQIITNIKMETNIAGIYAAGDVRADSIRQVIAAAGDGATAAWRADKYIDSMEG